MIAIIVVQDKTVTVTRQIEVNAKHFYHEGGCYIEHFFFSVETEKIWEILLDPNIILVSVSSISKVAH